LKGKGKGKVKQTKWTFGNRHSFVVYRWSSRWQFKELASHKYGHTARRCYSGHHRNVQLQRFTLSGRH